ncbi:RluA family pseudouridine synthase [Paenibacillus alvei]|uniref:Pseudouridine synthase n=1 Tax=Paenibacillus alvei TaxID=44250 RepID=A0A383R5I7_PAEAL|nr:RluA family pseudouridine synthase [Paenibacillus alvei]SYX82220.1 Pseudouridine synthase [Paenibacillus alvei]
MTRYWRRQGEWIEFMPGKAALQDEQSSLAWLISELRLPKNFVHRMNHAGDIRTAGDRLRVKWFVAESDAYEPADAPAEVLYEDDACLVVYKPAGMAVHPTTPEQDKRRDSLAHAVACHYLWTGQASKVLHIHRLDVDTTGPVLYAKQPCTQVILDEMMREKRIERIYHAIVQGTLTPDSGTIDAPIGKDRHHRGKYRVSDSGVPAITHYETLQPGSELSLVRLTLETGRTHQIRVHMSANGHPLAGDTQYGGDGKLISRQALHGESLRFIHPLSGEQIVVDAPWPEDMLRLRQKI